MTKKIVSLLMAVVMMVGMLTFLASADEAEVAPQICISLPGANANGDYARLWAIVDLGGEPLYYLCNDNGYLTATGASADNYNVKVAYPEAGKAAVYLKNANLKCSETTVITFGRTGFPGKPDITGYPVTLVVEADSTLTAPHRDPVNSYVGYACIGSGNADTITITGPGKLTAVAHSNHVISYGSHGLIVKDANLDLKSEMPKSWGTRHAFYGQSDLTIDNSTVVTDCTSGTAITLSDKHDGTLVGETYNLVIKNGSKVNLTNLISNLSTINCTGSITFENSDVEITSKAKCFNSKPTITGVNALGGTKPENAKAYNEKKANSYTYFKCGADVVLPTEPTVPAPTTPPATQPTTPATQPTTPATQPTTPATQPTTPATQPTTPATTTPATQATTPETQATTPATDDDTTDEGGSNVLLYVILGVLVAGAVAAAVVIVLKNKKDDAQSAE